jgi:general secretion pathway protein I
MRRSSFRRRLANVPGRRGFSLLEVVLSLAILGGTIAALGEVIRLGTYAAQGARDVTQAQLLCESKMAEIAAGWEPLTSVREARFSEIVGNDSVGWLYSIDVEDTAAEGLYAVYITVTEDLPIERKPAEFSLVSWMADPSSRAAARGAVEGETVSTEEATTETTAEALGGDAWEGF